MPNGKPGDNPLSDLVVHGFSSFPKDIEEMLLNIHSAGRAMDRYPLGENWPYSPKEFDWEKGKNISEAYELLSFFLAELDAGRGDHVMLNPRTKKPLAENL